uniref:Interleukin 1 receptor accessory protein n=1 Tax=Lates calcarifer TaxID=8187 RepID=A0A4W6ESV5_LATCA
MASVTSTLLFIVAVGISPAVSQTSYLPEPVCYDWGESGEAVSVIEGEAGWLSCLLFSHPSVYNYTSTQSAGHNLVWYRLTEGQDLEQPITYSSRLSKDRERLWLQPATAEDAGHYICMLRNKSSCSKIGMHMRVLRRDEVPRPTVLRRDNDNCPPPVVAETSHVVIPLQEGKTLDCPDLQDAIKMSNGNLTVTWYHVTVDGSVRRPSVCLLSPLWLFRFQICDLSDLCSVSQRCYQFPFWNKDRTQRGPSLHFYVMMDLYQGLYYCTVSYLRRGKPVSFSRTINVTAVYPTRLPKAPSIQHPHEHQLFTVKQGTEVRLRCTALFPYLNSSWEIWWTVDGKTLDKLADPRFKKISRLVKYDYGDRTEESVLVIQDFQSEDLNREYNCSVRNDQGNATRRAQLQEEVSLPSVELGCGLGVTLVLMLLLFVVYHVFWLELLLLYRSWFGTDERYTDDKEYDVYISYARNSEEEQFVLSTLRSVLENELGYSVCIFDRDSLPGGTITDETLSFVARSRRLLVVVSPGYASQGSQALLELKAGIDNMALDGHLRVILVQYKPVQRKGWVRELRRARVALALVRWQGDKSKELTSRFWKRLRVELPVRRVSSREEEEEEESSKGVPLMRLQSQNSTNSQTGLITNTIKDPQRVLNSAA